MALNWDDRIVALEYWLFLAKCKGRVVQEDSMFAHRAGGRQHTDLDTGAGSKGFVVGGMQHTGLVAGPDSSMVVIGGGLHRDQLWELDNRCFGAPLCIAEGKCSWQAQVRLRHHSCWHTALGMDQTVGGMPGCKVGLHWDRPVS